ncbi:ROK family transcriptional regulator [Bacillus andreraoultii]|uniref:ROK family transcriptional regulator n=1 Tax=Bacillus andreraoultii TaxID=1499685 RepID=UPI00053AD772
MKTTPKSMKVAILIGIRQALLELGSATKAELSEKVKISFPTVSKFLSEMQKSGEVLAIGLDESSGGRRAKRYKYNHEYMLGLAIFLEKTETIYTVFNCLGEVKEQGKSPTVLVEGGLQLLTEMIKSTIIKYPKVQSLAIGVPGSVNNGKVFYIPGYELYQDFNIKSYFEKKFSVPVIVENDMNAAVLGYYANRRIEENQSLVYLYSGQNGPGAGILINGDVVRGSTFFSGEVSLVPQYDQQNFGQALDGSMATEKRVIYEEKRMDAIGRLIASFVAMINPHTFIFCDDEVNEDGLQKLARYSSKYVPKEHLPELVLSNWKQDYTYGLQHLGLQLMLQQEVKFDSQYD